MRGMNARIVRSIDRSIGRSVDRSFDRSFVAFVRASRVERRASASSKSSSSPHLGLSSHSTSHSTRSSFVITNVRRDFVRVECDTYVRTRVVFVVIHRSSSSFSSFIAKITSSSSLLVRLERNSSNETHRTNENHRTNELRRTKTTTKPRSVSVEVERSSTDLQGRSHRTSRDG